MKAKIRVHGKSQSRTALGIINAYLKLHPDSTLADLQQAFPKSLNPKGFTDNIIVPEKEAIGNEKLFFEREDELVILKNGERLTVVELWKKEDFDAICEHAKQYGIEVARSEGTKPFEKGSYELEYLGEAVPPVIPPVPEDEEKKKRKFNWWWILLLILVLLILLFCWKKCCSSHSCSKPNATPVENVVPADSIATPMDTDKNQSQSQNQSQNQDSGKAVAAKADSLANNPVRDAGDSIAVTMPDGKEWKFGKNSPEYQLFSFLNSEDAKVDASDNTKGWITMDQLRFEKGKTRLLPESENQLKNIAMIMKFFPNANIKLGGYTDNTGTDAVNKRVSSERAKVAAEKLISLGIEAKRVAHEGYGSLYPVCPENNTEQCRAANRRIDLRVTQK